MGWSKETGAKVEGGLPKLARAFVFLNSWRATGKWRLISSVVRRVVRSLAGARRQSRLFDANDVHTESHVDYDSFDGRSGFFPADAVCNKINKRSVFFAPVGDDPDENAGSRRQRSAVVRLLAGSSR
jgi:hypothetical protein